MAPADESLHEKTDAGCIVARAEADEITPLFGTQIAPRRRAVGGDDPLAMFQRFGNDKPEIVGKRR